MSRSRRKAVIKDKGITDYNKIFRRVNRQRLHENKEPIAMRSLINDYIISDFKFNYEFNPSYIAYEEDKNETLKQLRRK